MTVISLRSFVASCATVAALAWGTAPAAAQGVFGAGGFGGGLGGAGGFGGRGGIGGAGAIGGATNIGGNTSGTTSGTTSGNTNGGGSNAGGIMIDAHGVLTPVYSKSRSAALSTKRKQAVAQKFLSQDVNQPSKLRKVSLVRLEEECRKFVDEKQTIPLEMQFLAGLQRIDYVFVFPEQRDIVIAGPAEGFAPNEVGRVVGVTTKRPTLRIDDLVVALRMAQRGGKLGVSIDPVPERLAQMNQYIQVTNRIPANSAVARARYHQMARILGMQDVSIWGVPADSHFAQAMVEADYRMKLVSVGLENPGVRGFRSHLAMLRPQGNSTQRWWFTPLYDAFYTTEDGNAFQFAGQRVQLLAQEELVNAAGQRSDAAFTRLSTRNYAKLFTEKFPEMTNNSAIFAELQNLVDLAILGALLKKERLPERIDWTMPLFLDPTRAPLPTGTVPRQVSSVTNYKLVRGKMLLGLIAGGVEIDPMQVVRDVSRSTDTAERLGEVRTQSMPQPAQAHPWWWD